MKSSRSFVPVLGLNISILVLFACLVGTVYFFRQIPPPQPSQPLHMLVAEPSSVDLGKVGPAFHEATVKLINKSKYPIAILDIKMTCSCTQVSFSRKMIAVGESTELICSLNTNGKEGKTRANLAVFYVPQINDVNVGTVPRILTIDLLAEVMTLGEQC